MVQLKRFRTADRAILLQLTGDAVSGLLQRLRLSPSAPAPLSHRCTDPHLPSCTPRSAPGPLLIFRKIHLYGKSKKSTHDHQTARPIYMTFFEVVVRIISSASSLKCWSSHFPPMRVEGGRPV